MKAGERRMPLKAAGVLSLVALLVAAVTAMAPAAAAPGDTVADRVFGQGGSFTSNTCNNGGRSASSLCETFGAAVDGAGNLYVSDGDNQRVLEYDSPLTTDTVADRVFGQPDFTTGTGACDPPSASSLCGPIGVAVDGAGNLYVADSFDSRVLEYDSPLTTDAVADRVFGQSGSFTSNTCNVGGVSAGSLCQPFGVAVDGAGNLYVADTFNSRVLEYDNPLTSDTVADAVLGQSGSFTSNTCNLGGVSAGSLCFPFGAATDASGNLYVSDGTNNRVLEYDIPLATDTVADGVFGQVDFVTGQGPCAPPSAGSLCQPVGVAVDGGGNLYVADFSYSRVLEYDSPLTMDSVADRVFGQDGSFTSIDCNEGGPNTGTSLCDCNSGVVSASSLCQPEGLALDGAGNLYIADTRNRRVLEYDVPLAGLNDARLKKISASSSVVLSDGTSDIKNVVVQVRNEGDHPASIGVYVDTVPPGGITNPYDCTPIGRVINTVVTLAPGEQTTVNASLSFNCADVAGALTQTYTIMAAADAHADDGGACAVFQIQSMTCFNALADDDNDSGDNRATTSAFTVK